MKNKKIYILLVVSILVAVLGISYAFFSLNVIGNDTAKINKITAGTLELTFTDTEEISLNNMLPGDSVTKTIKVTNTGTIDVGYNVGWTDYTNEITNNELIIEGTCKRLNSSNVEEGTCNNVSKKAITGSNIISNISIEPNVTHEYTLKITFKETNKPQNYNKSKAFNGKLNITESTAKTVYCTYDGELVQGAEYVNGQYTYRYMQEGEYSPSGLAWSDITTDGWGVQHTDKTSTDAVTTSLCTYINDKPIVSMSNMFTHSQASSIELSNFNTSNIISMNSMFYCYNKIYMPVKSQDKNYNIVKLGSEIETQSNILDLSSFDTSNVTDMSSMFDDCQATTIDVSSFNTSKVTDMSDMFSDSQAVALDLSSFDTSNVTNMNSMFYYSQATTIDLSNFDTSNVNYMSFMFSGSEATTIDVSNFNTSNVIDMKYMFSNISAASIKGLEIFDTSEVTDMSGMFSSSQATTINLSSFDTRNVTNMERMFKNSKVTALDLSNFDTNKVTNMEKMFENSQATVLDLSSFDTRNVTIVYSMFNGSAKLKTIYASDKFSIGTTTGFTTMFTNCTSLVGGAGTTYDSAKTDKTYAHIDGGTSNPGYFTAK